MMKKILLLAMALILLVTSAALADTKIDGSKNRNITVNPVGLNEAEAGVSPTTGRVLDELEIPVGAAGLAVTGRYMPMLVQIDNAGGGIGWRAPWGANYADIVYESPLYLLSKSKSGIETRISFLFSDIIPDAAGPVRSARVGHAWLREEWDCGFVFYGQQTYTNTNVLEIFKSTGADSDSKNVLFSGIVGINKPWKKFFSARSELAAPHDKSANTAAMSELINPSHVAPNHTFLFTDEPATGKAATKIDVHWNSSEYDSTLLYDAGTGTYVRYMNNGKTMTPYVDLDTQEPITFDNVIVQHTITEWSRVDAPVTEVIGEGNADYFMNGVRVAGYWKRESMGSRTVYYDLQGNEMKLQRGKTLIILLPLENFVSYGAN